MGYVGDWAKASGTVTANTNGDTTVKITNSGGGWDEAKWGIQAQYQKIPVVSGNTYKYTATIVSDKTKQITIKTTPSGIDEPLAQDIITLQAGKTYTYEVEFTANSNMVDIVYAFGSPAGEASVTNANITITGNNLVVTKVGETEAPATVDSGTKMTMANDSGTYSQVRKDQD
ncbi:MAG: hypothetical protein ACLR1A_04665 [Eubacterium ventriosum]